MPSPPCAAFHPASAAYHIAPLSRSLWNSEVVQNSRHALDLAQKLSHQLRAAEDRIAELEAEATAYRDRADRAEQWLHKVYTEIEDRFLRQKR